MLYEVITLLLTLLNDSRESSIPIHRFEFPVLLRGKILNFKLAVHYERQRRSLHPSDGKHLFALPIFDGIQTSSIHAQRPVTDSA